MRIAGAHSWHAAIEVFTRQRGGGIEGRSGGGSWAQAQAENKAEPASNHRQKQRNKHVGSKAERRSSGRDQRRKADHCNQRAQNRRRDSKAAKAKQCGEPQRSEHGKKPVRRDRRRCARTRLARLCSAYRARFSRIQLARIGASMQLLTETADHV
jgi:hypothetical protein